MSEVRLHKARDFFMWVIFHDERDRDGEREAMLLVSK